MQDASVVAKRVLMLLEGHRASLATRLRHLRRASKRYEQLHLLARMTQLERDSLGRLLPVRLPTGDPVLPRNVRGGPERDTPAKWARPWGSRWMFELRLRLDRYAAGLEGSRRRLSVAGRRKAKARADERFAAIMASVAVTLEAEGLAVPALDPDAPAADDGSNHPAANNDPSAPISGNAPGDLNVNDATHEQLRSLSLSITEAARLIVYRERLGGFGSVDELDQVPGFPRALREELKRRLTV